ncbi:MAG: gliding motility-associated peptidyl-prolyl isomerase GldI [Flavobacteriaceae bacterium]|nr:gliding motility-associated peptidyl-prolyl isomerase GldI [Bacteroidia bacterium]NNL16385.1 gliding motility-associated peptidyl-prolyl isomerase GldI [Flavobacteriaceae bacterium]
MNKLATLILLFLALTSCKSPEARKPVSVKSGTFLDASAERNKALHEKQKQLFENYMTQRMDKEFIASSNGFWYTYNSEKSMDTLTAKFGDVINFDFDIKGLNGNIIYSKEQLKTRNYAMDQEKLFSGLREGLKLMKQGETMTFLFPSQKAFGYYGDNDKIGTNVPIICEVTVNSITKNESN